ncbi:hypothetical protein HLK59_30595 [Streptomyces sp. S3(2020)]|uniref:hypothetical protein n=1 Tax=Streptomyces sp. S3(2020) TaxID=2732044 RepID=UPI001487B5DD|nr:hypothetical protein [Streptomyces sp. S3(2020)]NNN34634.1 hypothetical protein [Streptomyces sp. S3(2020)]
MTDQRDRDVLDVAPTDGVDDYTQGLRTERALARLAAITDPIARVRSADDLAEQARSVQGAIGRVRRQAIYEATLRPGHTGESVAAELGVSAKAVSAAVSESRAQDRQLFRSALEILMRPGVCEVPADQLAPGLRARDVLMQARVVLRGRNSYDISAVSDDEFAVLEEAEDRARYIHRSAGMEPPPLETWRRLLAEKGPDEDRVPDAMRRAAAVFAVLPGIVPLYFDMPDVQDSHPRSGWWRIGWGVLPAEEGARVFDAGPHRDGWATTEYLVWFVRDLARGGYGIWNDLSSPPPFLNEPGECLSFSIEGDLNAEKAITPNEFVRDLRHMWADQNTGFMELDWPELPDADD